jgi:hypothetical protein
MVAAISEVILLKQLMQDRWVECNYSVFIFYYNQAARYIANNPVFHKRTKCIEIDYHYIHEKIKTNEIKTPYVPSQNQLNEIFTKS